MVGRSGGKGVAAIRNEAIGDGRVYTAGLILLFRKSERPDRAAIRAALSHVPKASISFDPGQSQGRENTSWAETLTDESLGDANAWLELLVEGLTFDLIGLAPGPQISAPPIEFRIDCPADLELSDYEAVGLAPGPHLSGGMQSLIVARSMAGLGVRLAEELGNVIAFYWLPSLSITGPEFFASTVDAWIEGGPFPALGLSAFRSTQSGGLTSVGLAFFTGQEVIVPSELASDPASATRLAMRLVNQLVVHGPLHDAQIVTGPDGRSLELSPDSERNVVRVRSV